MKTRKQKTMGEILQTATEQVDGCGGGYFSGQHIYDTFVGVWKIAFRRGYDKALRDQSKEGKHE